MRITPVLSFLFLFFPLLSMEQETFVPKNYSERQLSTLILMPAEDFIDYNESEKVEKAIVYVKAGNLAQFDKQLQTIHRKDDIFDIYSRLEWLKNKEERDNKKDMISTVGVSCGISLLLSSFLMKNHLRRFIFEEDSGVKAWCYLSAGFLAFQIPSSLINNIFLSRYFSRYKEEQSSAIKKKYNEYWQCIDKRWQVRRAQFQSNLLYDDELERTNVEAWRATRSKERCSN